VFIAALRDRAHWVGDRPTFDVTPEGAVYPSPWPSRWRQVDGSALSADEFLSLYEVVPDARTFEATPDSAAAPLLRWAQEFPDRAAKEPAAYLIRYVRRRVVEKRYESRESPLAGTYRVIFRTAPHDSLVLFARTERHPTSVIRPRPLGAPVDPRAELPPIVGHYLLTEVARTIGELPSRRPGFPTRQGYFAMIDSALAHTDSGAVFAGSVDLERTAASLAPDSLARMRLEEGGRHKWETQRQRFRAGQTGTPGQFVIAPDGRVTFNMVIHRDSTPVLTVQAERVSREHLQPWRP
jgi:hypothetical protein